jgi:crossover junction endonuclease MUS81
METPESSVVTSGNAIRRKLYIDNRERQLIDALETEKNEPFFEVSSLHLGDAQVTLQHTSENDDSQTIEVIMERKTLADLCASIKDGRYREQKKRMLENIDRDRTVVVYILENFTSYDTCLRDAALANGLNESTLQSCVYNLMFRDRIFVMFTKDVRDTAAYIRSVWTRKKALDCRMTISPHVSDEAYSSSRAESGRGSTIEDALLSSCVHAKRNKNITYHTCFLMQLCQIPGVSSKTARQISYTWSSMADLYRELLKDDMTHADRVSFFSAIPGIGKVNAKKFVEFMFPPEG